MAEITKQSGNNLLRGNPNWKKGCKSPNPKGRVPKKECITSLLKEEIEKICPTDREKRTWKQLIVEATMKLAIKGNAAALREIWERCDGKVALPIGGAEDLPPVSINITPADYSKMKYENGDDDTT